VFVCLLTLHLCSSNIKINVFSCFRCLSSTLNCDSMLHKHSTSTVDIVDVAMDDPPALWRDCHVTDCLFSVVPSFSQLPAPRLLYTHNDNITTTFSSSFPIARSLRELLTLSGFFSLTSLLSQSSDSLSSGHSPSSRQQRGRHPSSTPSPPPQHAMIS
jgi:hypothetical protein